MKLIAADFDGTLKQGEHVDLKVNKAILEFRKQGNIFGIITGRSFVTIFEALKSEKISVDFIVASNGACISDGEGNILFEALIDQPLALKILDFFEKKDYPFYTCTNGTNVYGRYELDDPRSIVHKKRHENIQITKEEMLETKHIISFTTRGFNQEDLQRRYNEVVENFKNDVECYRNLWVFDIMPKGVSKKTGLDRICSMYNPDEVYAIGDDFNDLEMIKSYHGYCVVNAINEVKEVSTKIYNDVKELIDDITMDKSC